MSLVIEEQISPNDEICWRCQDIGLPGIIPAGEEYKRITNGAIDHNSCADCWNRLAEECEEDAP
jgi:hypothetical protein